MVEEQVVRVTDGLVLVYVIHLAITKLSLQSTTSIKKRNHWMSGELPRGLKKRMYSHSHTGCGANVDVKSEANVLAASRVAGPWRWSE
jgi:hypothetical protein